MARVNTTTKESGNNFNAANGTGALVRAALNDIFNALRTLNSGSGDPSGTGNVAAYQPHINTSTNELKISNAANNGFVTLGKINTTNFGHADLATANTFTARQTFNVTSSITVPVGTTAQRDGSPANGMFRYNSTLAAFEGYANNQWGEIGGGAGATGGGNDEVFVETDQNVTTDYTLTANKNAHTVSPTINSGVTITVPSGAILVIL